jgi:hypothetical protein
MVAYMTSGTEKKLKFTAVTVKPEDMAEFLDILIGTNHDIKPSVTGMEIIRINEVTAIQDLAVHVQTSVPRKN